MPDDSAALDSFSVIWRSFVQISKVDDVGVDGPLLDTNDGGPLHIILFEGEATGSAENWQLLNVEPAVGTLGTELRSSLYVVLVTLPRNWSN